MKQITKDGIWFFIFIISFIFTLSFPPIFLNSRSDINTFGSILQILGTITIPFAIQSRYKTFGFNILTSTIEYIKKFLGIRVVRNINIKTETGHIKVEGNLIDSQKHDTNTLEGLKAYIDYQIRSTNKSIENVRNESIKNLNDLSTSVSGKLYELDTKVSDLDSVVKKTTINSAYFEITSIYLVLIGSIYSAL